MSRGNIFTIGPHARFLETLAGSVLDGALLGDWDRSGPFWLSDVTIILPTRRSRLALAEIFAKRLGGATLLPDIRTFGGEVADEEPFLPPLDAPAPAPVMSMLERRLILSRLISAYAHSTQGSSGFASPPNAAELLWLADSLSDLVDDLETAEIARSALKSLVPEELAANWQSILEFLDLVLKAWPKILADRGKVDAVPARTERLKRQAQTAALLYGDRPVIAAGSTGSVPATARLLAAILKLKRGSVVLPGLDTTLTATQHDALLAKGENTHGHPQYGLAHLLTQLGRGIGDVIELADGSAPRSVVVRQALALADDTPRWPEARASIGDAAFAAALDGVSILVAPNADLEARGIAISTRTAVANGKSVGIVTPDQPLARRIANELQRHGIEVDDPAGTPLYQSAMGRLARICVAVAVNQFAAVDLMTLLRHASVTLGLERSELIRRADIVEFALLRGQFPAPGLNGLRAALEKAAADDRRRLKRPSEDDVTDLHDLFDRLERAFAPLVALVSGTADAALLAKALTEAVAGLGDTGRMPGAIEFAQWATELAALSADAVPFATDNFDGVLEALMAKFTVRQTLRRRDDVHIWGALEARLQNPDVMVLAGLNEGTWPAVADSGPWMSRKMRIDVGLEPPERQQGQAAHDFEMAMGNREVILAYAARLGTSPALPSRLVQRLDAFIGEARAKTLREKGAQWLAAARAMDASATARPAQRPLPRPPVALRPKTLSVTEIETLMRSPYDLYAKHTLRLRRLEPLGGTPDARERGSMIHEVFARFVEEGHDFAAPDAAATLLRMAQSEFSGLDMIGERVEIWLKRFARAAEQFLDYERGREMVMARHAERSGEWLLPNFTLRGRADRIDQLSDGSLEILDFKTGSVPQAKDMRNFDAPQLLLEAAMAKAGAFASVAPLPVSALTYIKVGLGPEAISVKAFRTLDDLTIMDMADEVSRRMQRQVDRLLLRDDLPMAARIRPDVNRRYGGDYDHLARTDEWTLAEGADE